MGQEFKNQDVPRKKCQRDTPTQDNNWLSFTKIKVYSATLHFWRISDRLGPDFQNEARKSQEENHTQMY